MAPNTGFTRKGKKKKKSLILCISFLPFSKEHIVEMNRGKINYGRSRLPVLFWCTIKKKKYRHVTLAKDYTLITFPKADMLQTCRFHGFCLAHGNQRIPIIGVFLICCADFHPILFRGGHIHFIGLYLSNSACNEHPNILKHQL